VFEIGGVRIAAGAGSRWADGVEWGGRVAIGAGCEIANRARLTDSVLLPGCSVAARASLHGCIVGPTTRIPKGARFEDVVVCRDDGTDAPLPPATTRVDDLLVRPLEGGRT
jgi:NDP-sugar pyrophosphorylase family protein